MKKIFYISSFLVFALLFIPLFTNAQTDDDYFRKKYTDDKMRLSPELEKKAEIEKTKDGKIIKKENESFKKPESLKKHLEIIKERLLAGTGRLEQFITRIESRNEKIKSAGVDVSASTKAINDAKSEIQKAKTNIDSLIKIIENITEDSIKTNKENPETFIKIRTIIRDIKTNLKSAHQYLVLALTAIKKSSL
jgi:archaellum component FlaC